MIDNKRVEKVMNFIATSDLVVAIFPKTFQTLRMSDLGSAGHDGFLQLSPDYQVEYIKGGHSTALQEKFWESITYFIVNDKVDDKIDKVKTYSKHARVAGKLAPFIFIS